MATLSKAELQEIADLWLAYTTERGTFSVEPEAWKDILTPELYRKAVDAGYFGAPGSVSGINYEGSTFTGVRGTTADDGSLVYELFRDGELIATESGDGSFDTVAFAARHGYSI